jgi:hypothetical protein
MMQIWPHGRLIAKFQRLLNRLLGTGLQTLNKWVENEGKEGVNAVFMVGSRVDTNSILYHCITCNKCYTVVLSLPYSHL